MIDLYSHQQDALEHMKNGCILCGGVGSGKSRTSLAYYERNESGRALYIITTARKRDTFEWEEEITQTDISEAPIVDSWNNISKYADTSGAFFIFDEQHVKGSGAWVKAFLRIARNNHWILLSATPGDRWEDYIPAFIANGFYRNRTAFNDEHIVWKRFSKFPQVDRYLGERKLLKERDSLLVKMDFERETVQHHEDIYCEWDDGLYKQVMHSRCSPVTGEPFINAAGLCLELRMVVNTNPSRLDAVVRLIEARRRVIIFYNYNYELDILRGLERLVDGYGEWNGKRHDPVPTGETWVYLVQYTAGNDGWNCTACDSMIFYSANYSWSVMTQAAGRIDRMNTPFKDLYYYHLWCDAPIDRAVRRAIATKGKFNETKFAGRYFERK